MFRQALGYIPSTACTSEASELEFRQFQPFESAKSHVGDRELVVAIANEVLCSKCGVFKRSGRHSCCAPGGSWHKNCGGDDDTNVDHRWSEGVKACERKFGVEVESMWMHASLEA